MSNRITNKDLETKVARLNAILGRPETPWSKDEEGKMRANLGNFHLSYAYGGACLHEMTTEGGGVNTPLVYGHVKKRELFELMDAFINGIEYQKRLSA